MTEREKMENGLWYDANYDVQLGEIRAEAKELCRQLSLTPPTDTAECERILRKLLPNMGRDVSILAPFIVDYGFNCFIGDHSFSPNGRPPGQGWPAGPPARSPHHPVVCFSWAGTTGMYRPD